MSYFVPSLNTSVPERGDVQKTTPNPASAEMIEHLENLKIETVFDRFEMQQPQCGFGLRGSCCRMCQWGPCRISQKNDRGICGRDMNMIVISNILRSLVAGMAGHGRHAHEVILTIMGIAEGTIDLPLIGERRIQELGAKLGIPLEGKNLKDVANDIARVFMDDLSNLTSRPIAILDAYAPDERKEVWKKLGIIPRSASYEMMESLHMTTLGGCSDWNAIADQEFRSALAYCYSTLFASSFATEILYGIPEPKVTSVNYGVLKEDHVNILIHGHSPVMAEKVVEMIRSPKIQQMATDMGAKGIVLAGMCCTGTELLARYGIPSVTNIMGQELAMGTGAVDAVVVDMQCVIPGMKMVADCFGTEVITTCNSNRIPGATHIPFDPENPATFQEDALNLVKKAVSAYGTRDRTRIRIPDTVTTAMTGWSYESIVEKFGGISEILELLKSGIITGIATVVGCNTPKVSYESNHVRFARGLIKGGVLITTTGCSSHALLNAGLCNTDAADIASDGLRETCKKLGIPPVLSVGGCVDNIRSLRLFTAIAELAAIPLKDMPFMFVGPEPGNEKAIGQGATFLCHGISNLVGFPAPLPVLLPEDIKGWKGSEKNDIMDLFVGNGLETKVGAKIYTRPNPDQAIETGLTHIKNKRKALGWD